MPYEVRTTWITRSLSSAASSHLEGVQFEHRPVAFDAVIPLLGHHAMDSGPPDLEPALARTLRHSFRSTRSKHFVQDARALTGLETSLRKGGMALRTQDALTAWFTPPRGPEAVAALPIWLKASDSVLGRTSEPHAIAATAMVASQVFLTIHPFHDGNGRTARLYFAAQLHRFGVANPIPILAMALMYRDGCHRYHEASWLLRAGDATRIVDLYLGSIDLACQIAGDLGTVEAAVESQRHFLVKCWHALRDLR